MCRFSASLCPPAPEAEPGLEALLDDDFNWFDAINELSGDIEDPSGNVTAPAAFDAGLDAFAAAPAAARESDSSDASPGSSVGAAETPAAPLSGSDTCSSYDLVEMFKQQVEQQSAAAVAPATLSVPVGASSFQPQYVGAVPFAAAVPQQQLMCGIAGPFASACVAPAFLPAAALAGATPAAALLSNNTAGASSGVLGMHEAAGPCPSGSAPTSSSPCGRRGGRAQKTQEEIDAAVERIKQKRRESAQRSRARKNDYMRQLELENQALKDEVQRLQQVLAAVQRSAYQQHQAAALVQLGAM